MIASLMEAPLAEIWRSHGLRLDHVFTYLERAQPEPKIPMSFQRLTMGGQFPDGSFALITVVERTHDIDIPHLDPAIIGTMPDDAVMRVQFPPRQLQSFVA